MFCQSCGSECPADLNYCNRCGANIGTALNPATQLPQITIMKPLLVISVLIAAITLGGFGILVDAAIRLSAVFHQTDPVLAIIIFGMITILITDSMLLRLLSRLITLSSGNVSPKQLKKVKLQSYAKQLDARPMAPISSVTDHTTRTFAPIYKSPHEK